MTFIKRFIFVWILLVLAFFVYRLVSPTGAKSITNTIQSVLNATVWTNFSLDNANDVDLTTSTIDLTGAVLDTWDLKDLILEDEFLESVDISGALLPLENDTSIVLSDLVVTWSTSLTETSVPSTKKTTTSTIPSTETKKPSSSSIDKDIKEFKDLFQNAELK